MLNFFPTNSVEEAFLEEVAARYPEDRLLMVMDGVGWHRNQDL